MNKKLLALTVALFACNAQAEKVMNIELGPENILTIYPDSFAFIDDVGVVKIRLATPSDVYTSKIAIVTTDCLVGAGRVGVAEPNVRSKADISFTDWSFDANNVYKYAAAFICSRTERLKPQTKSLTEKPY